LTHSLSAKVTNARHSLALLNRTKRSDSLKGLFIFDHD